MIVTARVLFQAATQQRSSRVSLKNLEEQLSESGMAGELAGWPARDASLPALNPQP